MSRILRQRRLGPPDRRHPRDRAGNLVTVKLSGPVEVYLRKDAKSDGQEAGEQGAAE